MALLQQEHLSLAHRSSTYHFSYMEESEGGGEIELYLLQELAHREKWAAHFINERDVVGPRCIE